MIAHRDERLPPRTRRILHLDVDAFLASVEQALHPELRGRPVVVGGSPTSRNLVMSCSYAARRRGVRPGMFASQAARQCPEAVFVPGDSKAANQKREDIVRLLLEISPRIQVTSIDDFLVDLTGSTRLLGCAFTVAERMRARIWTETHMPVTVGVGTGPILARLAGKLGKPGGVAEILPGCERAFLARLPVRHLPGVGHKVGCALERFSIHTVGELALVSREVLFASFGPIGLTLHDRAHGRDDDPVQTSHHLDAAGELVARPPRSIRRDSTFEPEEGRRERVEAMLLYLVERASARLREHRLKAGSMEVRLSYVDTRPPHARARATSTGTGAPHSWLHKRKRLPRAGSGSEALGQHALALLAALPRRRALVKRVGVSLLTLSSEREIQGELFGSSDRDNRLEGALDHLRARHGFGGILRGSSLLLGDTFPTGPDGLRLRTPSLNQ
jgi:DNA polymerase-4